MKKILLLFLLLSAAALFAEPLDIIVMIDTSSSMEPYFDSLIKYLFINTLNNNMYLGDKFHLLCFSSYPTIELAETLKDEEALKYIQKQILFLNGRLIFGEYTDLLSALKMVIDYAEGLPNSANTRILLLSDGIHDPPPDSPYANISVEEARSVVQKYVQHIIDKDGWSIRILRMPGDSKIQSGTGQRTEKESVFDTRYFEKYNQIFAEPDVTGDYPRATDERRTGKSIKGITSTSAEQATAENGEKQSPAPWDKTIREGSAGISPTQGMETDSEKTAGETDAPAATHGINLFDELQKTMEIDIIDFNNNNNAELPHVTIGFPKLVFPDYLGKQRKECNVPFIIQNYQDQEIIIAFNRMEDANGKLLSADSRQIVVKPRKHSEFKVKIILPDGIPYGPCTLPVHLFFDDDYRISPREGKLSFEYIPPISTQFIRIIRDNLYFVLMILVGILFIFILFLLIKRISFSFKFSSYFKASPWMKNKHSPFKDSTNLVEMRVAMQNPHIGFRNIHKIDENTTFSIGGKHSQYLIFLIPIPAGIAEITKRNGQFTFIPKKMGFFPGLTGSLPNCLNKEIKVVSNKGYELRLTFIQYVSPLDEINKLLHSINGLEAISKK